MQSDFEAQVPRQALRDGRTSFEAVKVRFPPEWPGAALALFPTWATQLATNPQYADWGGTMIERSTLLAVGQMSFKELPDEGGTVELGYGVNPSSQNRGYATEMARALVAWAVKQPAVRRITAECREDNAASVRVLEKVGFRPVGRRLDDAELLITWEWSP